MASLTKLARKPTYYSGIMILMVGCLLSILGCKRDSPIVETDYRFSDSITVDNRVRTYLLNLPPTYYESSDFALVIAMHGGGGSAQQFESSSLLTTKADEAGFIVVYPEGVVSTGLLKARTWNAGGCCAFAQENNIDDVKFISTLIDKLVSTYKINPKKVYATGHSNGGMMSYRLACELSTKIAAIAPNGSTMVVKNPCNPSRPVPILHMHSEKDTNVPYQGGYGSGVSDAYFPPLDSVFTVWSAINACSSPAKVLTDDTKYKLTEWSGCSNNAKIDFYLTKDGGHAWPGGLKGSAVGDTPSTAINANDLLWNFFQQYQLP